MTLEQNISSSTRIKPESIPRLARGVYLKVVPTSNDVMLLLPERVLRRDYSHLQALTGY
jgi:hypothetical protein